MVYVISFNGQQVRSFIELRHLLQENRDAVVKNAIKAG